ncbi:MAG: RNase adapter RapZ [Clostridiales bacterium]|nr:RNase adapter RapZ [Clostridiales bacterium]
MRIVIITGLSGAGKSKAVECMEDLGYYCIDNLPPQLMNDFVSLGGNDIKKVAFVMDIRGGEFFDDLKNGIEELKQTGIHYSIVFLEASEEVLIRRYKETRRIHPVSKDGNIQDGILKEKEKLKGIRDIADYIIDTSDLTTAQLKTELKKIFDTGENVENLTITITSFGYKNGIPLDSDIVLDVRFLPNPFYLRSLKNLTGNNRKVKEYVLKWPESKAFIEKSYDLIQFLIPYYIREGKSQLVMAFGCTGGQHRSVVLANEFYNRLSQEGKRVILHHRDLK